MVNKMKGVEIPRNILIWLIVGIVLMVITAILLKKLFGFNVLCAACKMSVNSLVAGINNGLKGMTGGVIKYLIKPERALSFCNGICGRA